MGSILIDNSVCNFCKHCIDICPFGAILVQDGKIDISDDCRMCLQCVKQCPQGALSAPEMKAGVKKGAGDLSIKPLSDYKGVMVFAEFNGGRFSPVTFELIGKARELAGKIGQNVLAVAAGTWVTGPSKELLDYGVDKVLVYDHPALKHFISPLYTDVLQDAVAREKPGILLIGATHLGRSLAPRLAARLRTGLTADCTFLDVRPNGDLVQTRPAFGGNIMATILTPGHRPQMATVRHKVMPEAEKVSEPAGVLIPMELQGILQTGPEIASRPVNGTSPETSQEHACIVAGGITLRKQASQVKVLCESDLPRAESIAGARVIVAVGRGLRSQDDIPMFNAFAESIGGMLACTRPLVEKGWFSPSKQVGLSGRTVRPEVYIACGISGAVQHTAGMDNSKVIFAINSDKEAPIFEIARYGIVADMYELVPEILKSLSGLPKPLKKQAESGSTYFAAGIGRERPSRESLGRGGDC